MFFINTKGNKKAPLKECNYLSSNSTPCLPGILQFAVYQNNRASNRCECTIILGIKINKEPVKSSLLPVLMRNQKKLFLPLRRNFFAN